MTFTEEQLTLKLGDPRMEKIRYVFQGAGQLPECMELNFKLMKARLKSGQEAYFSEVRDHIGQRLRLIDIFGTTI